MAVTGKTDFKRKVRLPMRRLPEKSARCIRSNLSNTPREQKGAAARRDGTISPHCAPEANLH
jgi:hypothetical protein